jgi:hypothetical protein
MRSSSRSRRLGLRLSFLAHERMAWRISSFDMVFSSFGRDFWRIRNWFQAVVGLFRAKQKPPRCGWLTGYSNVVERFLDCEDYIYSVFLCALCGKRLCFFRSGAITAMSAIASQKLKANG